jgi:regulator of protease activity HflC (stomatin/prohibitin superfamily)
MQIIPPRVSEAITGFFDRYGLKLFFTITITTLTLIVIWPYVFITIHSGEAGVKFRRFSGTEMNRIYTEGLHFVLPWDIMYIYSIRVQNHIQKLRVLTKNGLPIELTIAIRYRPDYNSLTKLHRLVGPNYLRRVILPETEAVLRREIGGYEPIDIYTSQKDVLSKIILNTLSNVGERYVRVDDMLIKSVKLPTPVRKAIEEKLVYEQRDLTYKYRLRLEEKEAQRKRIEALGIRDYNARVSESLANDLIRWQGVQATKLLATSSNAKTVIIGGGKDGLPVILGNADAPVPTAIGATAPAPSSSLQITKKTDLNTEK